MKKDIHIPKVEGIYVAIVQKEADNWEVHLINDNEFKLENVIIASKGYGKINNKEKTTSVLRHVVEFLGPKSTALIEPITPDVFPLTNEYWVSYFTDEGMFDKKFIFLPDTILEKNLTDIPLMDIKGILHT